jgi:hypothetical protein
MAAITRNNPKSHRRVKVLQLAIMDPMANKTLLHT